ncbi:hypothetical protein BD410DRAFT_781095 [Rickenella mellea]|uniref:Integral membrane protein n=1 Tax=Rickenella mellea TaxID=50990 RepID=A0A4Y7QLR9_9AGAM|nr:hypothetical protein BD410DRAFT_781095 [Rickenella mellea]
MSVTSKQAQTLLTRYLVQLSAHPLRTKAATSGVLLFIQEVLASHLAGVPSPRPPKDAPAVSHVLARAKVDAKALKMALYGILISAPLGHVLVGRLQKAFAGKTGTGAKVAQILASNLLIAPIQTTVYLASIAVINGAKSVDDVIRTIKGGFFAVMRITWITSPLAMVAAQKFIPPELWVPFFNLVSFVMGTYFTTKVKMMHMSEERKKAKAKETSEATGKAQ